MPTTRINDIDVYYEEYGDAAMEPLVLIMGFALAGAAWGPQIEPLAQQHRVILFDNRGAGRTTAPEDAYSIEQMADDVAGLLRHLGIASAHIVAQSMGGMIAQRFALRYPAMVRSLVLMCTTAGGPHSAGYEEMMANTAEGLAIEDIAEAVTPEALQEFALYLFTPAFLMDPGPGFLQMVGGVMQFPQTLAGMKGQLHAVRAHDTYDELPRISAPTLVMAGADDQMVKAANSPILAARIPGAELRMFDGLRHGFGAEQPDEVNRVLLEFLGRHSQRAAA